MRSIKPQPLSACGTVETLERRIMMDGTVTASLAAGDLVVRGDSDDNQIVITRRSSGKIRISGEDGTTVNGQQFVELSAMTDDLMIQMTQGGVDHVELQGRLVVPDDLSAQLGAGELLLEGSFGPVEIGGDLLATAGPAGLINLRNEVTIGGLTEVESRGEVSLVGGQALVPNFSAANFTNSTNINNPYFPVVPGAKYKYLAEIVDEDTGELSTENIIVEMLPQTKTILGIQVRIVRDRVFEDGRIIEDTFDWYAQDNNGNVWYFGENVTNFEYDNKGNVTTDNDGSWIAGVDGAQAGIIMEARPREGHSYFQEFAPGNVLDQAVGLATNEQVTVPVGTYSNAWRSQESSVVEPFSLANKLYAPGVGTVMEFDFDLEDDEILQTTTLTSLTLNGVKVTRVVPTSGFTGTNATGRFVGGPRCKGAADIDSVGPTVVRGATFSGYLEIESPDAVIIADSNLRGYSLIRTQDTLTLRDVFSDRTIALGGDPDDAFIFDSDIHIFKANFAGGNDSLFVEDSDFDLLEADGGGGTNIFDNGGGNHFGTLRLTRFTQV